MHVSKLSNAFAGATLFLVSATVLAASTSAPAPPSQAPSNAHTGTAQAAAIRAPGWVKIDDARLQALLPAWPQAGSLAADADIYAARLTQAQRTPEQAAEAQSDAPRDPFDWAAAALASTPQGAAFTKAALPRTLSLLNALQDDVRVLIRRANAVHPSRPRP